MIDAYFSQTLQLKKRIGVDEFNQPIYEIQESVYPCRLEFVRKIVRTISAQQYISNVSVYTSASFQVDDIIVYDGVEYIAMTTSPQIGIDGSVMWYEGALQ